MLKSKTQLGTQRRRNIFNGMKVVYKILNNQDKLMMKHFYHIRCDPDLGKGFCDMQHIPCDCTGC